MNQRHNYDLKLCLLGSEFEEVIIDQHYAIKHNYLNDDIILEILKTILPNEPIKYLTNKDHYNYYVFEPIFYKYRPYRVILLTEVGFNYLGVINIFRVQEKKL